MKRPLNLTLIAAVAALAFGICARSVADDKKPKLKTKPYPLNVCVISGEKLDSMGEPYVFAEGDQEVQLCCKSCLKDFSKDKKASLEKIDAAWKKVKPYPLEECIVTDDAVKPGKGVGLVYEGREFHFCCKDCVKEFKKEPAKFVKKLDEAAAKKKS